MEEITHGIQEKDGHLQADKKGFKRTYRADLFVVLDLQPLE